MRAVSIFNVLVTIVGAMGADGAGPRDRRPVRPGGLRGEPADARNRHPHGDRRQPPARCCGWCCAKGSCWR